MNDRDSLKARIDALSPMAVRFVARLVDSLSEAPAPTTTTQRGRPRIRSGSSASGSRFRGDLGYNGNANTNSVLPSLGRRSGVSRRSPLVFSERPVLTATYCRPPTA